MKKTKNYQTIIMHVDVNSAYLAWEAVHALENGATIDYRDIPAIVGGNQKNRHGIVLAKSLPAKSYDIKTGETVYSALKKCPTLLVVPPSYDLYKKCSNALEQLLKNYTPRVQRFSVDEFFIDFSGFAARCQHPLKLAYQIRDEVANTLGFTVNIGISNNKLLAKIAGDFEKPNKVHTLFPEEIERKLWPLPVGNLYMVGRKTLPKLKSLGIVTVGDLANADDCFLKYKLKSFGTMLKNFARGIESSEVCADDPRQVKGIGNSTTIKYDVEDRAEAHMILLSLTEMVGMRLRAINLWANAVAVAIKASDFSKVSHQRKLAFSTNSTSVIYDVAKQLLDEAWNGKPIRHLAIRVADLTDTAHYQLSLLDGEQIEKKRRLDQTIDQLRNRYGQTSIFRGTFSNSPIAPIKGGTANDSTYPSMKSQL